MYSQERCCNDDSATNANRRACEALPLTCKGMVDGRRNGRAESLLAAICLVMGGWSGASMPGVGDRRAV